MQTKLRAGTENEWSSVNPILEDGELGYDESNKSIKIGDGLRAWNNLPFLCIPCETTTTTQPVPPGIL